MFNHIFLFLTLFLIEGALGKQPEYKSWKFFKSDYGYSVKYPSCWEIGIDDPDESGPLSKIRHLGIFEKKCLTPRRYMNIENSIGIVAFSEKLDGELRQKQIRIIENKVASELKNSNYLMFKKNSVDGGGEIIFYVEYVSKAQNIIRWKAELFCTNQRISITAALTKDPGKELLERFKNNDLAIPEPYKSITESIKCITDRK